MEELLELYQEPYNPDYPVVCFDEMPYQMLGEINEPLAMKSGKQKKVDYEYKRMGICNVFIFFQPLKGWRRVVIRKQKTKVDFSFCIKKLVDEWFPKAKKIKLVCDNLNTHSPVGLYENFSAAEARRLTKKIEFCFTPKHGSWLNMAECELSVLSRQCLKRRIPTMEEVATISTLWAKKRTQKKRTVDWRFTVEDARKKLARLYPK